MSKSEQHDFGRFSILSTVTGRPVAENLTITEAAGRLMDLSGVKRGDFMYDACKEHANYRSLGIPELEDRGIWVIPHDEARFLDVSGGEVSRDVHVDMDGRYELYKQVMSGLKFRGVRDAEILPKDVWESQAIVKTEKWSCAVWDDKDQFNKTPSRHIFHNWQECTDYLTDRLRELPEAERFTDELCGVEHLGIPGLAKLGLRMAGSEGMHYTSDRGGEHEVYSRLCRAFGQAPKDLTQWSLDMDWGYLKESDFQGHTADLSVVEDRFMAACPSVLLNKSSLSSAGLRPANKDADRALYLNPYGLDTCMAHLTERRDKAGLLLDGMRHYSPVVMPEGDALQLAVHGEDWGQGPLPVSKFDIEAYHTALQETFEQGLSFVMTGTDCSRNPDFPSEHFRKWFDQTFAVENGGFGISKGGVVGAFRDHPEYGTMGLSMFRRPLEDTWQELSNVLEGELSAKAGGAAPAARIGNTEVCTDGAVMSYVAYASSLRALERSRAQRMFGLDHVDEHILPKSVVPRIHVAPDRPDLLSACREIKALGKMSSRSDLALLKTGRAVLDRGSVFLQEAPGRGRRRSQDLDAAAGRIEEAKPSEYTAEAEH